MKGADVISSFLCLPQGEWTEDAMGTVAEYVEFEDIQLEVRD